MENLTALCINKMIEYNSPDIRRVNHALKVTGLAAAIGVREGLSKEEQEILEAAAVLHDIGIHKAEELYNSTAGNYQQELGPDIAAPILEEIGIDKNKAERICYLIAHHHTYNLKEDKVLQILIEADFIVNIDEENLFDGKKYNTISENIFITETGKEYLNRLLLDKMQ